MNRPGLWTAPGSILVAGEYLITEEGGEGLALASGGRGSLRVKEDPREEGGIQVEGLWRGGRLTWPAREQDAALPEIVRQKLAAPPACRIADKRSIRVDTRTIRKGFGSSALSCLLITRGMLAEGPGEQLAEGPEERLAEACPAWEYRAVEAHRAFQNGRGSGYDVLCSFHGGCGRFTGGRHPLWSPAIWPQNLSGWLIRGRRPVSTAAALQRFEAWKIRHPRSYSSHIRLYTGAMDHFMTSLPKSCGRLNSHDDFFAGLDELTRLGRELGDATGVPARPALPEELFSDISAGRRRGALIKCLGAGDEMALLLSSPGSLSRKELQTLKEWEKSAEAIPFTPDKRGLCRENECPEDECREGGSRENEYPENECPGGGP